MRSVASSGRSDTERQRSEAVKIETITASKMKFQEGNRDGMVEMMHSLLMMGI